MLKVISPHALVSGTVAVSVFTVAVGFISLPLAFVFVAIDVPESSLTMSLIVLPISLILCTIRPYLDTTTMSHIFFPLSLVPGTIFKLKLLPLLILAEVLLLADLALSVPVDIFVAIVLLIGAAGSIAPQISRSNHPWHTCSISIHLHLHLLLVLHVLVAIISLRRLAVLALGVVVRLLVSF